MSTRKDNQSVADTLCRPPFQVSVSSSSPKADATNIFNTHQSRVLVLFPAPASNLGQAFFCVFGDIVFWLDIQFLTVVFSYFYFGLLFLVACPFLGQAYQHHNPSPERPIPFRTAPPSLTVQTKSSQFFTVQWPSLDTTNKIVISFWVVNVLFLLPHSPSQGSLSTTRISVQISTGM